MASYCTIWYHIVQYGIILYNMVLYFTLFYNILHYFTEQLIKCTFWPGFLPLQGTPTAKNIWRLQIANWNLNMFSTFLYKCEIHFLYFRHHFEVVRSSPLFSGLRWLFFAAHLLYIGHGKTYMVSYCILYNMVSYCTIWYHIVQYGTILYNMVSYCTIWYHIVQYGIILYNMASYCTIWYHIIQYGIILYCMLQAINWYFGKCIVRNMLQNSIESTKSRKKPKHLNT